jgi:hypothetical protein
MTMNAKTKKDYQQIKDNIEQSTKPLSRGEYREVLEELDADISAKIDALNDDEPGEG